MSSSKPPWRTGSGCLCRCSAQTAAPSGAAPSPDPALPQCPRRSLPGGPVRPPPRGHRHACQSGPAPGRRGWPRKVPPPPLPPRPPALTSPQYRDRRRLPGTDPRIQNGGASSPRRRPLHITGQAGGTAGGKSRLALCPPLPAGSGPGEAAERGVRGTRTGTPAPLPRTDVETGAP